MTVTASPRDATSYNVLDASTATKTDTPIFDTPLSIQVIPQQVLRDQQAVRLQDALKNISGVQFTPLAGNTADAFTIRGFTLGAGIMRYRNGRPFLGFLKADLANIEQIEVLKGPAAVLFGRIEPGGLINLITKKPLDQPYYSLQQQFGSYDFYRTTVDATGPIDADKTLLYRFNLGYTDAESFRDELFNRALLISPSLTWRPWEGTEVNLNYEYRHEDILFDSGIPVVFADGNNRIPPISRRSQFSEPSSPDELEYHLVDFNWSHRFNALNADWTVRNGFQYQRNNLNFNEISADTVRADGRTLDRFVFFADGNEDFYSVFLNLTGKFQVWGTDHTVLVGWDYYNEETSFPQKFSSAGQDTSIDLFNPVLGRVDVNAINVLPFEFFSKFGNRWHGVYFQDQLSLFDNRLHILGGGRYDWTEAFSGDSAVSLGDIKLDTINNTITARKFSPRVGVVYQPWAWLSLYGNYVESLGDNNGQPTASGSPLPPQEGEQHEAGIKTDFFDGRLSSTLAFYNLKRTNIPAADLSTPVPFDQVAIGEARSRGIELDISGQLTDRLNLIGTYAFTDAKITKDAGQDAVGNPTAGSTGDRLPGAPRHQGSLWAKYQVLPERFEIGSGVFLASNSSPGIQIPGVLAPGFVRWDAFAAYHMNFGKARLTAQVNVNNILDKQYFNPTSTDGGSVLFPGDARTVLG
ncbi:MAG: TonB-dependent siderophore receptor, partial [Aestuariivirga sp.]